MVDTTIVNVININTVRDIHTINMAATTKQQASNRHFDDLKLGTDDARTRQVQTAFHY